MAKLKKAIFRKAAKFIFSESRRDFNYDLDSSNVGMCRGISNAVDAPFWSASDMVAAHQCYMSLYCDRYRGYWFDDVPAGEQRQLARQLTLLMIAETLGEI